MQLFLLTNQEEKTRANRRKNKPKQAKKPTKNQPPNTQNAKADFENNPSDMKPGATECTEDYKTAFLYDS